MKYFGTDGIRGEANVGLTVEHAYKIGRFVGWYYGANRERKARVIVGKDTRRSSYMFEAAGRAAPVARGAARAGRQATVRRPGNAGSWAEFSASGRRPPCCASKTTGAVP